MTSKRHTLRWSACFIFSALLACLALQGCGTMNNGRRWGEDATLRPGWSKAGSSAYNAVTSPMFYVPAAAALLMSVGDADEHLSTWAMDHTPVFGSMDRADRTSEDIASYTGFAYGLSVLATPGGKTIFQAGLFPRRKEPWCRALRSG